MCVSSKQAVFEGLAQDGGLLVPHFIPDMSDKYKSWKNLSFDELAVEIAKPFVGDEVPPCSPPHAQGQEKTPDGEAKTSLPPVQIPLDDLKALMKRSYGTFTDKQVVPTKTVGGMEIMELFHGPTYAFKDVALQVNSDTPPRSKNHAFPAFACIWLCSMESVFPALMLILAQAGHFSRTYEMPASFYPCSPRPSPLQSSPIPSHHNLFSCPPPLKHPARPRC